MNKTWKKLGIRSQITAGFLPLVILMSLLSVSAISGMNGLGSIFASYRDTVGQTMAVSAYSDQLHKIQSAVETYRTDNSDAAVTAFREGAEAFAIDDPRIDGNAALKSGMTGIRADIGEYSNAFEETVVLSRTRDKLIAQVTEFGPWTAVALNDIMRSAWRQADTRSLYQATRVFDALTQSLSAAEHFVRNKEVATYITARDMLETAAAENGRLGLFTSDDLQKAKVDNAARLMENYRARLADLRTVLTEIQTIQTNRLDVLAPKIASGFASLEEKIAGEQNAIDRSVTEMVGSATTTTVLISLALILTGLVLAYVIGRLISHAVRSLASTMERLANGDDDIVIEGTEHRHELGAMARSLQIFQETGRAKLVAEARAEQARLTAEEERLAQERSRLADARVMEQAFSQISAGLTALAHGDLTVRIGDVDSRYQPIRNDFNGAVATLEQAIHSVVQAVATVRSGLEEISHASNDLAVRTEQQAASLEETVTALGDVTRGVNETAESASRAQNAVALARSNAESGEKVVAEAIGAMTAIQSSSERIGSIISVIDEIAFQTNLLALNAGVEAARAGDAGKGFAVVAQEVRELAQRSANAAKEIKALILASSTQVETGVKLVSDTGGSLKKIVHQVADMSSIVSDIAVSSHDQANSLKEVSAETSQMDEVTQQNAAMVQETTAAAQSLSREMETLSLLTQKFRAKGTREEHSFAEYAQAS
ncbi:methyl-accepting chemotaxis protein [Rhizobiaceae bacterium BDR2-2]|uniref:Methyl-accepting chemotaxis protein n=1 Tax=Ectorhizobium quercum TaxID=2965071 RepID=A0AAE3SUD2_9HYPH|nr:methyl-accepting chemotaxis protein [Ectorhizobium quercum]MCX8997100.1 methyl-accepting chemotaxis protein [Ectorhizobium quercum]